jgi:DNA polymerase-1
MPANAKVLPVQIPLFGDVGEVTEWKPLTELPSLSGISELAMDCETTGKNKHYSVPVGTAYRLPDGRKFYLPIGHSGGNLDGEKVERWKRQELRDKKLVGLNIGFDAEVELNGGVDLEAQGCILHDVAHDAALLNENRYGGFNLNDLGLEYCERPKRDDHLDKSRMAEYHSSKVGEYAEDDADLAWEVYQVQKPLIAKDKLEKVSDLEDRLIWPNNYMERNGARLDVGKLMRFTIDLDEELSSLLMGIHKEYGINFNPNTEDSWDKLFWANNLDSHKVINEQGDEVSSYTEDYLKTFQQAAIVAGLHARRLLSLKSKYLTKYERERKGDKLPFQLYQLRAGEEDKGTVVGRYSSAHVNIQQVFKVANQLRRFGPGYIIRELMIPDDGFDFFTADGSQLQFRLFAHLSKDENIIKAYLEGLERWKQGGEDVDYHQMTAVLFSMTREVAKNQNFGLVMGLGRQHLSEWLGLPCNCRPPAYWQYESGRGFDPDHSFADNERHSIDCPARRANDLCDEYHKRNPAAKRTLKYVEAFAKENGYLPSLLGRRRRFGKTEFRYGKQQPTRYYKGLSSWLQMSEADIVKLKILRVYNERHNIGIHKMRMPVHDEITGDIEKNEKARERLREVLMIQEIPCRVPITWADEYGANWRECSGK